MSTPVVDERLVRAIQAEIADEIEVALKVGVLLALDYQPGEIGELLGITPTRYREARARLDRAGPRVAADLG